MIASNIKLFCAKTAINDLYFFAAYYLSVLTEDDSKEFAILQSVVFLPTKDICQVVSFTLLIKPKVIYS